MASGQTQAAIVWLDRAARMVPDDPTAELLRASALLGHDRVVCRDLLVRLIDRNPRFRDAQILKIACEARDGQSVAAQVALMRMLRVFAPPDDEGFRRLAGQVAHDAGAPGWLGLAADGTAIVSRDRSGRIELWLDGVVVAVPRSSGKGLTGISLPRHWRSMRELRGTCLGNELVGSPLPIAPFAATEGVVGWEPGRGVTGWAWHPADPDRPAALEACILDDRTGQRVTGELVARDEEASELTDRHRRFALDTDTLPILGEVRVMGRDGRELAGSPLQLGRERAATARAAANLGHLSGMSDKPASILPDRWRPMDAGLLAGTPAVASATDAIPQPIDVVIPVFKGSGDFRACLATLRDQIFPDARILVIDDASPDTTLRQAVDEAEAGGMIHVLRHAENRGFPAAANTGLRYSAKSGPRDVLLLNSDTLVPPGALQRLVRAAYSAADIGSVTPMTNDGTILSYPRNDTPNEPPDLAETLALDTAFQTAHGDRLVDIPTAIGFCMFIRHDCLADVGLLREDAFAQGYGEENDWSLRAGHLGWRHVAAAGVFVGHVGGQSFGAVKSHLIARNVRQLNRLHPGYDRLIADFIGRDPLATIRRGTDIARWRQKSVAGGSVVLITHDKGGGVARHVRERCETIRAEGRRPVVVHPGTEDTSCRITDGTDTGFVNLDFTLPAELDAMVGLLARRPPTERRVAPSAWSLTRHARPRLAAGGRTRHLYPRLRAMVPARDAREP